MPLTHAKARQVAAFAQDLANRTKNLAWLIEKFIKCNNSLAVDWTGDTKQSFLIEDMDGNIDGVSFSRTDMANAIGSFDNIRKVLRGEATEVGDHLGNLEKIADANPQT